MSRAPSRCSTTSVPRGQSSTTSPSCATGWRTCPSVFGWCRSTTCVAFNCPARQRQRNRAEHNDHKHIDSIFCLLVLYILLDSYNIFSRTKNLLTQPDHLDGGSEQLLEDIPEHSLLGEVVVDQVHQEVVVVDVGQDRTRFTVLLVELCPLLLPQAEGLVLMEMNNID